MSLLSSWPSLLAFGFGFVIGTLLTGVSLTLWGRHRRSESVDAPDFETRRYAAFRLIAAAGGMVTIIASLLVAMRRIMNTGSPNEGKLIEAGFVLIAGLICALILTLIGQFAGREPISIESKWGSLGGSKTGYDISQSLALLMLFAGCVLALLVLSYQGASARTPAAANQAAEVTHSAPMPGHQAE